MASKYFWDKPRGLNHDLARHKREEQGLLAYLEKEKAAGKSIDENTFPMPYIKMIRENRAAIAAQIGKPKPKPRRK